MSSCSDNRAIRNALADRFATFFKDNGFLHEPEEPLIPRKDDSVLFSNATITPLKKFITTARVAVPGYFVIQRCLRTQNLKRICDETFHPEYMCHFRMIGVLAAPEAAEALPALMVGFFENVLNLAPNQIEFAACDSEMDLIGMFERLRSAGAGYAALPMPMIWRYGLDGISGRGIDIRVKTPTGKSNSVGQLVELSHRGSRLGFELGVGIETFLARQRGVTTPFAVSEISDHLPFRSDSLWLQLMDSISVLAVLYANGVRADQSSRGSVARKLLRITPMLADRCEAAENMLMAAGHYTRELGSETDGSDLVGSLAKARDLRKQAILRLGDFARNQAHLVGLRQVGPAEAVSRIQSYGERLGRVWRKEIDRAVAEAGLDASALDSRADVIH